MNNFKVSIRTSKSKPIIVIYSNQTRHRFWNGKAINVNISSEENPNLLKAAFELKLREGWRPQQSKKKFEVRIGKQKGDVVYDLNKKRLSLKEKDNHFYLLTNDFVAGTGLEPVTFGL